LIRQGLFSLLIGDLKGFWHQKNEIEKHKIKYV